MICRAVIPTHNYRFCNIHAARINIDSKATMSSTFEAFSTTLNFSILTTSKDPQGTFKNLLASA